MSQKITKQYKAGSGNELQDKMRALKSSSAMTYNLLGNNDNITLIKDKTICAGIYSVEYEKQFNTLKTSLRGKPANLDAFLYCGDNEQAIACEMKMTEWIFNRPGKLRSAYLNESNYEDKASAKVFIDIAQKLIVLSAIDSQNPLGEKQYPCVLKQYDGFQMFKHMLACYNYCRKQEIPIKKLSLVNCVWEIPFIGTLSTHSSEKYKKQEIIEHKEFEAFYDIMQPVKQLFKSMGIDFNICYYSFHDFMGIIRLSKKDKNYLERYTF